VAGFFEKGEVTDENADMVLISGLVPRQDLFRSVTNPLGYSAFTGAHCNTLQHTATHCNFMIFCVHWYFWIEDV
jgi:hypothetical protein